MTYFYKSIFWFNLHIQAENQEKTGGVDEMEEGGGSAAEKFDLTTKQAHVQGQKICKGNHQFEDEKP